MNRSERTAPTRARAFWTTLSEDQRAALRSLAINRKFPSDTQIIRQGDHSASVFILLSGQVKVTAVAPGGHQAILAVRDAGDIVGEMAGIEGLPRTATVITVGPVSALWISAEDFGQFVRDHPPVAAILLRTISGRLRYANVRRSEYGDMASVARVAAVLVELAERYGRDAENGILISLRISQQDMAGLVAASREAVIRALRRLRDSGLLTTGRQQITIHDLEALRLVATAGVEGFG